MNMRKLAFVLCLLPLGACSLTWEGQGNNLTEEQKNRGIKDVAALSSDFETQSFYRGMRRRTDGINNAFGRDLGKIQTFFDRHFWNYDENDPAVNYPSDTGKLDHSGRFLIGTAAGFVSPR